LPMLRCVLSGVVAVGACASVLASPAQAWDAPAGSPPGWRTYWVITHEATDVFADADGEISFGRAASGMYFRVDAPEQQTRLWVYNPVVEGWAWLPRASTRPVAEPRSEQVQQSVDPRTYLYQQAPDLAPMLDCIITGESGWDPNGQNPRTKAAGLAQFLPSTWATTPEGQLGRSPFEPLANIDAAIWLARTKGWTQWQVFTFGYCR
jgi:hypothetical protein